MRIEKIEMTGETTEMTGETTGGNDRNDRGFDHHLVEETNDGNDGVKMTEMTGEITGI